MIQTADLSIEPVKARRITVIDALRGFALLGVIIIHMMQRFINIFAFLFGLSFFIQMDSASRKGVDFRKRFLWRMAILLLSGWWGIAFSRRTFYPYMHFSELSWCSFSWALLLFIR